VLATGHANDLNYINLWDTANWNRKRMPIVTHYVGGLVFSPEGTLLAVGGLGKSGAPDFRIYDTEMGKQLADLSADLKTFMHDFAFSPDGTTLAAVCGDWSGLTPDQLYLWDVSPPRLRCVTQPREVADNIQCVIWSPGMKGPTLGTRQGYVLDCDGNSGKLLESLSTGVPILHLARSPDGKALAAGGKKGVILHPAKTLLEQAEVLMMAYSADGGLLAVPGRDGRIYLWDTSRAQLLDKFTGVSHKDLGPDDDGLGPSKRSDFLTPMVMMPDNKTLISGGPDEMLRFWDISYGELSCLLSRELGDAWWVKITPDGQTVIAVGEDVRFWDMQSRRELHVLGDHGCKVLAGTLSRDGRVMATADVNGTILVWEIPEDRAKRPKSRPLIAHKGSVGALAISPDGATLASGGQDGTVRIWDTASGTGRVLVTEKSTIFALAFHPDGKVLASGGNDMSLKVWDVVSGEMLKQRSEDERVRCLAYSPDGAVLAVGLSTRIADASVMLRRSDTLDQVANLGGHPGVVRALAFTPDGSRLATGADHHFIRLWHVNTSQQLLTIDFHKDFVTGLAFSPDGQTLASASQDGTARLWFAPK
jgi:WD40 repeat protein